MRIRRCAVLIFEPRESLSLDLDSLLGGGDGLADERRLYALAAHLDEEIAVSSVEAAILGAVPVERWSEAQALRGIHGDAAIQRLLDCGLLIGDSAAHAGLRERDQRLRDACWRPLAAVSHYFSRWQQVRSGEAARRAGYTSFTEMIARLGAPPPVTACKSATTLALPAPQSNAFDALLRQRATCRNFAIDVKMDKQVLSTLLHRVFGAQAVVDIGAENPVMKRNSPSGGGLHPIEAYLIVQRVQGLATGLYHYQPLQHGLELMRELSPAEADDLALRGVAAQRWFADAPVLVALTARFARSFWKYRNHAKAYRVVLLDAGHLSQTLYLAATEQGLGAFVTAAVNEIEIEQAFGLDALEESVVAVCGFGPRGTGLATSEFDPRGEVWPGGTHGAPDN